MWREKSRDLGKSRAYSALPITSSELRAQLGILLVEAFVEFLDEVVDQETKKEVRTTLVRDKQLPHTSFKALATGILAKLGEKVAGEAGKEIAGEIVGKAAKPAAEKAISFYRKRQGRNEEHLKGRLWWRTDQPIVYVRSIPITAACRLGRQVRRLTEFGANLNPEGISQTRMPKNF
jgi:hypothetical protein